ncbi:MAG: DUF1080 domain-containing protein [Planctomycetes bacterium]|nr:DUF1080 domain-containing protein [Planctomycetota bacterium]
MLAAFGCGRDQPTRVAVNGGPPRGRAVDDESGFAPIRLADCATFPPEASASWSSGQPGMFVTTGSPRGYLYTRRKYGDFTLRLEFRFERPETVREEAELSRRNTGILVYVPDEHGIWPRSPEVQGRHDEMASIKSNAADLPVIVIEDDEAARQLARRPVGQWNALEILSEGGALTTYLNRVKIAETLPCPVKAGRIGFQAEGDVVHFRNVRIRVDE